METINVKTKESNGFSTAFEVAQSPHEVFHAILNVRGWWSEGIEGESGRVNDEFDYHYKDVHRCKMKLVEVVPDTKVVWQVLENYFSFTSDTTEWKDTTVSFEIISDVTHAGSRKTRLLFTHHGLVPEYECYTACVGGWTQYIGTSLYNLITTGKGQPNSRENAWTIYEVAARFNELAKQEKWFEIQDELFADNVTSIEPAGSTWLGDAQGKTRVREKGERWVERIEAVHHLETSAPIVAANHFSVQRAVDITVAGLGRIKIDEIILYKVQSGKIISEQFFY